MTYKLTPRDRRLLVFLAVLLIVTGCVWFVIIPTMNLNTDLVTEVASGESALMAARAKSASLGGVIAENGNLRGQLDDKYGQIYPHMNGEEIDALLTGLALSNGFSTSDLRELSIAYADEPVEVAPYGGEEMKIEGVSAAHVTFRLYGTHRTLAAFIDKVATAPEYTAIRVASYTWSAQVATGEQILTLGLVLYMASGD